MRPLANTFDESGDEERSDLSSPRDVQIGHKRSLSIPASLRRTKFTKSDLDAFMGKSDAGDVGPLANLKQDISILLKASMSPQDRNRFVNPFKVNAGATPTQSSLVTVRDSLPAFDDGSDCDTDGSKSTLSEHAGIECLNEGLNARIDRIFRIMTELMTLYDLETCLASIRENDGEQFFVVHRIARSKIWRTQIYVPSSNFSELLVQRGIPTIIPDMSKDHRFVDAIDAHSQLGRVFVQAPIGWNDTGMWIGVMNLVGGQGLLCPLLQDYDALMCGADEIASLIPTRKLV